MSKRIIAGLGVVAGLAVALAPVSTFAAHGNEADKHTDRLTVTVTPSCTFGTATTDPATVGISHNETGEGKATWNTATDPAKESNGTGADLAADPYSDEYTNKSLHIATYKTTAGKLSTNFATTNLTVICNNADGYTLGVNANALTNGTSTEDITLAASPSAANSGYNLAISSTTKATTATVNAATVTASGDTKIASNTDVSLETGDIYTVNYTLGVAASQKAATYTGDVVYTLYQGQDN